MIDPLEAPGDPGTEEGPSQEPKEEPTETSEPTDDVAQRLEELAQQNKELQRRLTQQGRELAEQRRASSTHEQSPGQFFEDPDGALDRRFQALEERMEQRRQAEQMLRDFAEEKGIPMRQLQNLNEDFVAAWQDPNARLELLARMHGASNTEQAVQAATKAAVKTATTNARAVTSESEGGHAPPPGKKVEDMTLEEERAYLEAKYGVAET